MMMNNKRLLLGLLLLTGSTVHSFAPPPPRTNAVLSPGALQASSDIVDDLKVKLEETLDTVKEDLAMRWRIVQQSDTSDFKQVLANVLAGDYDKDAVRDQVEADRSMAPCVMFTWDSSPSCKKAVEAMDATGFDYTIRRLDDPWTEGNPIRAEVGQMVGRTSVPMVFIGGKYVGGYDGGVDNDAPGLVSLAFSGKLKIMLESAGAKRKL